MYLFETRKARLFFHPWPQLALSFDKFFMNREKPLEVELKIFFPVVLLI